MNCEIDILYLYSVKSIDNYFGIFPGANGTTTGKVKIERYLLSYWDLFRISHLIILIVGAMPR